jgi:cytochrome b6-f complex iron-sulfur subunit
MSTGTILLIAIIAIVVAVALFLVVTARSSDRDAATGLLARETQKRDRAARKKAEAKARHAASEAALAPPPQTGRALERSVALERSGRGRGVAVLDRPGELDVVRPPMDAEQYAVTRRQFLNRGTILMFLAGLGGFGGALLGMLWPSLAGGFGSKVKLGKVSDILADIEASKEPKYFPEARTYVQPYPKEALAKAKGVYSEGVYSGMEAGVVALYQKCVHLGCKVPWCATSQWFECPCHGSQYNRVGERKGGPAPRGLDRFDAVVDGAGFITVDTSAVRVGPADGTNTTGQEAEGPHCVGGGH